MIFFFFTKLNTVYGSVQLVVRTPTRLADNPKLHVARGHKTRSKRTPILQASERKGHGTRFPGGCEKPPRPHTNRVKGAVREHVFPNSQPCRCPCPCVRGPAGARDLARNAEPAKNGAWRLAPAPRLQRSAAQLISPRHRGDDGANDKPGLNRRAGARRAERVPGKKAKQQTR